MSGFLSMLLLFLVGLQGFIMTMDEFLFHRRRGLPRFERWGHVADTSLFFLALLIPAVLAPEQPWLVLYGGLALASCLLITKDEWIHAAACSGAEQWCHALLFILHGPILLLAGLVWFLEPDHFALKLLPLLIVLWGLYQHLYWNVYYDRKHSRTHGEQPVLRRARGTLVQ